MKTYLDMGDNFIKRVKTPTSNDQASNKSYVDTVGANAVATAASNHPTKQELTNYLKKDGSVAMTGNLNTNNKTIVGLVNPTQNNQPTTKGYSDLQYLHCNGRYSMSGNLNMNNEKIINLKTPTSNSDATTKKYVDDRIPNTSSFVKKDGSVAMTGNLDLSNNKVVNLSDPTTDLQAANRGWVPSIIILVVEQVQECLTFLIQLHRLLCIFNMSQMGRRRPQMILFLRHQDLDNHLLDGLQSQILL